MFLTSSSTSRCAARRFASPGRACTRLTAPLQRFPCRDPFFKMLTRSLATYMNAYTAADYTLYPFSTINEKDFANLMAVYLDAAFFPLLTPQVPPRDARHDL